MANQLMQTIRRVVRHKKLNSKPPILLLPLGSKANISFSLGWVSSKNKICTHTTLFNWDHIFLF